MNNDLCQNKRKALFNYFSNINPKDIRQLGLKLDDKDEKNSALSPNSRNRNQSKHMSVDKYIHCRTSKNSKSYSIDMTNKSSIINENKLKTNLLEKERDMVMFKDRQSASKPPIEGSYSSNLMSYMRNLKHTRKKREACSFDTHCSTNQNKTMNIGKGLSDIIVNVVRKHFKFFQVPSKAGSLNNSKYCSVNTSFNKVRKAKELYKNMNNSSLIVEEFDEKEIMGTTREKIKALESLLIELSQKKNIQVNSEIDKIYRKYITNYFTPTTSVNTNSHNVKTESDKVILTQKINDIDKKYEFILKENKELKNLIQDKAQEFRKLFNAMNSFKDELKKIKNLENSVDKKTSSHVKIKSNDDPLFIKNNKKAQIQSKQVPLLQLKVKEPSKLSHPKPSTPVLIKHTQNNNIKIPTDYDLLKLDSFELINQYEIEDRKKLLYLPSKIRMNQKSENKSKVPKLDIINAMQELEMNQLANDDLIPEIPSGEHLHILNNSKVSPISNSFISKKNDHSTLEDKLNKAFIFENENDSSVNLNLNNSRTLIMMKDTKKDSSDDVSLHNILKESPVLVDISSQPKMECEKKVVLNSDTSTNINSTKKKKKR